MAQNENKILLHACCGVCSGYPISLLLELGYLPSVYFSNSNLDTIDEYNKRLEAQKIICKHFNVPLIIDTYRHSEFLDCVSGLEQEPERGKRCIKCIEMRLQETAKYACNNGFKVFASSLIISPHKNICAIKNIAENIANKYNLIYLDINFRKQDGFLKTNKISKELNIYRQNYCGCEFAKSGHKDNQ